MRETDYLHDEDPRALATSELVRELMAHGKRVFEVEAQRLRADLQRELIQAREELRADAGAVVGEAKQRVAGGLEAVKHDLREQAGRVGAAARPMAAGGILVHAALYLVLAAVVLGLGRVMPLWAAALIPGVVVAGVGGLLLASGKQAARAVGRKPLQRTNRQWTESKRWMSDIRDRLTSRTRSFRSTLSDDVWPKLRRSFAGAPIRTTSGNRLVAP